MSETGKVAEFGPSSHRDRALHPTQGLERLDDRGESPGLPLVCKFLFQTCQTFSVFGDRSDIFLEDDVLERGGGPDDRAQPAQVGRASRGSTRRADIMPQQKGFEAELGHLEIV